MNIYKDTIFNSSLCFFSRVGKANRTVKVGQKVKVYRNLNKPEFFSIVALEGDDKNKVIGYAKGVLLHTVQFKVSQASRNRLLREKRKNVHAFAVGFIQDATNTISSILEGTEVSYHPYVRDCFFEINSQKEVKAGDCFHHVKFQGANVYVEK